MGVEMVVGAAADAVVGNGGGVGEVVEMVVEMAVSLALESLLPGGEEGKNSVSGLLRAWSRACPRGRERERAPELPVEYTA